MSDTLSWERACRQGDEAQVSRLLPNQSDRDRSFGLGWAAEHNHLHLVKFLVDKGAGNWNRALASAAFGGHLHLVQFFIDRRADDWDRALSHAAEGGHLHLMQFLIDKGASDWNRALPYAASGGHLPVVQFFIDKGANDWNWSLVCATLSGHLHVVQLLIECGATIWSENCVRLLQQHPDVIIALFQRGKVPRERFALHASALEQQIAAFLEWQHQTSLELYNTCLLPHELCALIVAY
jgi:ankyrin repeat protein